MTNQADMPSTPRTTGSAPVTLRWEPGCEVVILQGDWTMAQAPQLKKILLNLRRRQDCRVRVDARGIARLDTAGAWLLRKFLPRADYEGTLKPGQKKLLDSIPDDDCALDMPHASYGWRPFFTAAGERTLAGAHFAMALMTFIGRIAVCAVHNLFNPRSWRVPAIVRHIEETGIRALPIIGLLSIGISMVIFYQGGTQLRKFGADIYTVDLTVVSLLREMGVLMTAIMVAGRSGSAFAAELGVMKMRGEIDALRVMGLDPIETLVLPRLAGLLFTLPALSFFACLCGLAGGGVMSSALLGLTPGQYVARVEEVATMQMFLVGMIKAPVFALLITAVCCYQGMSGRGSAEDVGKQTTVAVVQSIFLVIMADAVFSIVFSTAGI